MIIQSFRSVSRFLLLAASLIVLTSCGGGGGSDNAGTTPPVDTGSTININYTKGPVTGATAILLDANGNTVAGPVSTVNGQATFSNVTYVGTVYASFTGGSYTDEATGQNVNLASNFNIRSGVINNTASGTLQLTATPLTEIGFRRAEAAASGSVNLNTINSFVEQIADEFGLDNINLTTTQPNILSNATGSSNGDRYATVLAGITQQEVNAGNAPSSTNLQNYISNNVINTDQTAINQAINDLQTNTNTATFINSSLINSITTQVGSTTTTNSYSIGGNISGLSNSLTLQNNAGDNLTQTIDGSFTFTTALNDGSSYNISILSQPIGQICQVSNGQGTLAGANISNVAINCTTIPTYSISGSITGLTGSVTLQNNLNDDLVVNSDGSFVFATNIQTGSAYNVTISTQPNQQLCSVTNGAGNAQSDVNNVALTCVDYFNIGGTITGLKGSVIVQNNAGDDLLVSSNGSFSFATGLQTGSAYQVTVLSQPNQQLCSVTNTAGTVQGQVTNITLNCIDYYTIGGTVSGLKGSITLQNNLGYDITLTSSGSFTFATPIVTGGNYTVSVLAQPNQQRCTVSNKTGSVLNNINNVTVACVDYFSIGGNVTGLKGAVTLQNNAGDNVLLNANGAFNFATSLQVGNTYNVTILTQPNQQLCSVTNNNGTAQGQVSNISVNCIDYYTVGGSVTGLNGSVILQNNAGDDLTLNANGTFTFATAIIPNGNYSVSVLTQPSQQLCTFTNASGSSQVNTNQVIVTCIDYTIGGTVTGLNGTLTLQNNAGDNLIINSNGGFSFVTPIIPGGAYNVTVLTQPTEQLCTVTNETGIAQSDISNVAVNCINYYTVGGNITGLSADAVTLQNNATDNITVSTNGAFTFATHILDGASYNASVLTQPFAQTCLISNALGTVQSNITNVSIACQSSVSVNLTYGIKQLIFNWNSIPNATYYKLMKNPDGVSGFTQVGSNMTSTTINEDIAVHLHDWVNARYLISACNAQDICVDSNEVGTINQSVSSIGYFKASNTTMDDSFGYSISLSGDGNTMAVGKVIVSAGVHVFIRSGSSWVQQAVVPTNQNGSEFGNSLDLSDDGNTLAIGAREESTQLGIGVGASRSGAAYIFTRNGSTWSQQARVFASNANLRGGFGQSVSLSADGNTLAVGSSYEDGISSGINGDQTNNASIAQDSGAVYVFTRSGLSWTQQTYIKASNPNADDWFGTSVSLSGNGNTLAVGAYFEDSAAMGINGDQSNNTGTNSGAVYVFTYNGSAWAQQAYIKASNTNGSDLFGRSVSLSANGDTLAIGADQEDSSSTGINGNQTNGSATTANSGAAYVFSRTNASWTQQAYVKASNTGGQFGTSISLSSSGNILVVGAIAENVDATGINGDSSLHATGGGGAAYLFIRSGLTWAQKTYIKPSNKGGFFGWSMDLSSDGLSLAIGAHGEGSNATGINGNQADTSLRNAGAVYLY